jgi:Tfp pilus assembly protein FimT
MSDWSVRYSHYQRGASFLIELCIVSACLGLLSFWLTPGLSGVSSRYQKAQFIECLAQSIQLAKNEALASRQTMILCGSSDGLTCVQQQNWGSYWLVGEAGITPASPVMALSKILRIYKISSPNQLEFKDSAVGTRRPPKMSYYLIIRPNGQTYNNGTFTYTYFENGKQKYTQLRVNNLARTYEEKSSDAAI